MQTRTSQAGRKPIVGVLGCMAERLKEDLLRKGSGVDLVVGPDAYRDLPRLLSILQVLASQALGQIPRSCMEALS